MAELALPRFIIMSSEPDHYNKMGRLVLDKESSMLYISVSGAFTSLTKKSTTVKVVVYLPETFEYAEAIHVVPEADLPRRK